MDLLIFFKKELVGSTLDICQEMYPDWYISDTLPLPLGVPSIGVFLIDGLVHDVIEVRA